jgi:ketosteroid isomerase-like protein
MTTRSYRSLLRCVLAVAVCLFSGLAAGDQVDQTIEAAVRGVLEAQEEAWNRGDLEGFMLGYWNSPELVFQSGATVISGWGPTLERYEQRYRRDGKDLGRLRFEGLHVDPLCADAAVVRGAWHLTLKDGGQPHGLFTLVLRNKAGLWRIVHDHTSSAE